jgi:hypothetical protein
MPGAPGPGRPTPTGLSSSRDVDGADVDTAVALKTDVAVPPSNSGDLGGCAEHGRGAAASASASLPSKLSS